MKTLAMFDFDETITTKDTLISGVKSVVSPLRFKSGMAVVALFLPLFKKKKISSTTMKNIVSFVFFKGQKVSTIKKRSQTYLNERVSKIIDPWHWERFMWHKEKGHEIVVVTASFDLWVDQWANEQGIPAICTNLKQKNGRYTGSIVGQNCYDEEKIIRVKNQYDLDSYGAIYAYTDSMTDKCLLDAATDAYLNGEEYSS